MRDIIMEGSNMKNGYKEFCNKVIRLIPSLSLKDYVLKTGYKFNEKELLKIILEYSPTFAKRLEFFEAASHVFSDREMCALAKKRLKYDRNQYNAFMQSDSNCVYEVEMIFYPGAPKEDTYILTTFEDVVTLVNHFVKYYNVKACKRRSARYIVRKKTTLAPLKPSDLDLKIGTLGICILDEHFDIVMLHMYNARGSEVACKRGAMCSDCQRCIDMTEPHFPHFIKKYDLVAFYDNLILDPSHITYGIFCGDMEKDDYPYVILLDSEYITQRNIYCRGDNGYYCVYIDHSHPLYFEIYKPSVEDVPKNILDDYYYAAENLRIMESGGQLS